MFTIVISEKGGAERREAFDRNEISVGRVQGNDLMLPKGNVSKHHARLLFRDGRFIVTDLKSTNGTYVNGRKISQATIVREGDKIYVGDFVLRLESPGGDSARNNDAAAAAAPSGATLEPAAVPPPAPSSPGESLAASSLASASGSRASEAPGVQNLSHYPLERDPDSESAPELRGMPMPVLPGPPRLPQPLDMRLRSASGVPAERPSTQPRSPLASSPGANATRQTAPIVGRVLPREAPLQAARRLALITLIDRVGDEIDLGGLGATSDVAPALLERVEATVRAQSKAMRVEGEAPEGVDLDLLARDAVRELVELGPIGSLLEEDQAIEIHVARPDYVIVTRNGQPALAEPGFTSEGAVARAIARLAFRTGQPLGPRESVVVRRLAHGARMVAVGPPVSRGWVLTVRKQRRLEATLDDLTRTGTLSRPMATFLEACAAGRANLLVIGAGPAVVGPVLAALVSAAAPGERIVVFQEEEDVVAAQAQIVALSSPELQWQGEKPPFAAARFGADRIAVTSLAGPIAAAAIDAIAEGVDGVVAGVNAPSVRHGLSRLAVQVALARPGTSIEMAREAVAESFDIAIEVGRGAPEGRLRIMRISELAGSEAKGIAVKDVFVWSGGGGDTAFSATGTLPRIAAELASRGTKLDAALFKRVR
ncbi:MAG TPA: FHA domain-containing protein [Polyangiaceae bacterium]|nr:FHA domain-containing protein [Polyangiaceae bacterium]